jgi:hypothetical protein
MLWAVSIYATSRFEEPRAQLVQGLLLIRKLSGLGLRERLCEGVGRYPSGLALRRIRRLLQAVRFEKVLQEDFEF